MRETETEQEVYEFKIISTPFAHVPSVVSFAIHQYKHGWASGIALETMRELTKGKVADSALRDILLGDRLPILNADDLNNDNMTFLFREDELIADPE